MAGLKFVRSKRIRDYAEDLVEIRAKISALEKEKRDLEEFLFEQMKLQKVEGFEFVTKDGERQVVRKNVYFRLIMVNINEARKFLSKKKFEQCTKRIRVQSLSVVYAESEE